MSDLLRRRIQEHLISHDWSCDTYVALASRFYPTAVGLKRADAYLCDFGSNAPSALLQGDYRSEGRNVLESHFVCIPKAVDEATLSALVAQFVAAADAAVHASYAARLLRFAD
jgi:hypothetical protein